MPRKLPRTIRLDASDTAVFDPAANPGEWAVPGAFVFVDADPQALDGKARQALRNGFLGLGSFGWSTFVTVADATDADVEAVAAALADFLQARFGAPSRAAAEAAAREELAFAAGLCDHPVGTVLAVERSVEAEGLRERFRVVGPKPGAAEHARIWDIVPDADDADARDGGADRPPPAGGRR